MDSYECLVCKSKGFKLSVTGNGCTFCDGTEGGNPPDCRENKRKGGDIMTKAKVKKPKKPQLTVLRLIRISGDEAKVRRVLEKSLISKDKPVETVQGSVKELMREEVKTDED